MKYNGQVFLIAVACFSSLSDAIHSDSKNLRPAFQLFSPTFGASSSRSRSRFDTSFFPRGGADDESDDDEDAEDAEDGSSSPLVSVTAEDTLPAEIAGASLMAFRAAPTVGVPETQTNTITHNSHNHETTATVDVESPLPPVSTGSSSGEATAAAVVAAPSSPSLLAARLANLKERALPAVLMLVVVGSIAKFLKEDGLILLTLVLQGGMYQEATRVIGGDFPHVFFKWWWFATASVALNGPRILSWAATQVAAGATGMALVGIIGAVIRMNWKGADVEEFRDLLRQAAVSFLATLLVVLPSSYFIATLETFGMKWVALPAALVIINDTMAYFFGIAFGKHKLLPVISPSKTWEGFVGAALSTAVAAYFLLDGSSNGTMDAMVLSFMVSFIAPFGGFLASMIKRAYAQKDFGSLFPGHGGFVDRLDCQLVLAPMVFLYLSLTAKTN